MTKNSTKIWYVFPILTLYTISHLLQADAFNMCCPLQAPVNTSRDYSPSSPLRCVDCHAKRPVGAGFGTNITRRAPDLCLTFEDPKKYNPAMFYSAPAVNIEFKGDISADCGFTLSTNAHTQSESTTEPKPLGAAARKLLSQAFGYIYSQWFERPYRFVWSITIANRHLRIWRWSSTGVLTTEAIDYIEDATIVYQFLHAIGSGPYSRLGIDIGHNMTFGMADGSQFDLRTIKDIVECYKKKVTDNELSRNWCKMALMSSMWTFKHVSTSTLQRNIDPSPSDNSLSAGKVSPKETNLVVVSHPIWHGKGIYSRNTRCYLAIEQKPFTRQSDLTIEDLHMLKITSPFSSRLHESHFFGHSEDKVAINIYLAKMLSGGSIMATKQQNGIFLPHNNNTSDQDGSNLNCREVRWILLKQVGERISGFQSVKELLQVIRDAIEGKYRIFSSYFSSKTASST